MERNDIPATLRGHRHGFYTLNLKKANVLELLIICDKKIGPVWKFGANTRFSSGLITSGVGEIEDAHFANSVHFSQICEL